MTDCVYLACALTPSYPAACSFLLHDSWHSYSGARSRVPRRAVNDSWPCRRRALRWAFFGFSEVVIVSILLNILAAKYHTSKKNSIGIEGRGGRKDGAWIDAMPILAPQSEVEPLLIHTIMIGCGDRQDE